MPPVYANPSQPATEPGRTPYLAVCGKGLIFEGSTGRDPKEITDGAASTIMVVEADPERAVIWTRPEDWKFNAAKPLDGLGHAHPGGFLALFADASVQFISDSVKPSDFKATLTIAGGERLQP
jgi:hypothetical protein